MWKVLRENAFDIYVDRYFLSELNVPALGENNGEVFLFIFVKISTRNKEMQKEPH